MNSPSIQIIFGKALKVLKNFPDNHFDSIVTDPPYGLSDKSSNQRISDIFQREFNIVFPNIDEFNAQRIKYSDLIRICLEGSDLSMAEIFPVIKPFVGVPKSAVNFNSNVAIGDEKINAGAISASSYISDRVLMDKGNIDGGKYIGNYILDFGDSIDFSGSDVISGNFGKFDSGFFTMCISSIFSSGDPSIFPHDNPLGMRNGVNDIIGLRNDPLSKSSGSSFILTGGATENRLMLRFDCANTFNEIKATISAGNSDAIGNFFCPKLVRTSTTTSSLATKLDPCTVSFIATAANGTDSVYYLQLYLPKKLLTNIKKSFSTAKGFMGKKWDYDVPSIETWKEIFRVLKPGGHILVACGTRTQHRMAVNIEDAGFEIRDVICWHYGSGFPKSLNISKAIDNYFGAEREIIGSTGTMPDQTGGRINAEAGSEETFKRKENYITLPATPEAQQNDGFGTGIKPATEFWTLARKPISETTVAKNVLKWGVGGLNIDQCRIEKQKGDRTEYGRDNLLDYKKESVALGKFNQNTPYTPNAEGRWPANVIFDEHMSDELDKQSGITTSGKVKEDKEAYEGESNTKFLRGKSTSQNQHGDTGGASRFFYVAKASKSERNKGLENMGFEKEFGHSRFDKCKNCGGYILQGPNRPSQCTCENPERGDLVVKGNFHPTVKPVNLMRYLVRLITPKGGKCLDPFCGSGTTGIGMKLEGIGGTLIDRTFKYCQISRARISAWEPETDEPASPKKSKPKAAESDNQISLF